MGARHTDVLGTVQGYLAGVLTNETMEQVRNQLGVAVGPARQFSKST